jgi:hypothetical protein
MLGSTQVFGLFGLSVLIVNVSNDKSTGKDKNSIETSIRWVLIKLILGFSVFALSTISQKS